MIILLLAGESSGDLHGANLIKNLKVFYPEATYHCFGGDKMAAQGANLLLHYREMAFMGFYEVVKNIRKILRNLRFCKKWILKNKPDVIIYIDFPGFNMRVAKFAKSKGIRNIYYISPQIWAWKESRVHQIKRDIDVMISIIPFEKKFYEKYHYDISYVGHPLLDVMDEYFTKNQTKNSKKFDVALLPGSRYQEVQKILPVMVEIARRNPQLSFVLAGAPSIEKIQYENSIRDTKNILLISGKTYEVVSASKAAIVTSGTATLETALLGTPLVVVYKGGFLSYLIARQLIKVPYISLVNLILDRPAVPELIQGEYTVQTVESWLKKLLYDENAIKAQERAFMELREVLGGPGASARAAECIKSYLEASVYA